MRDQRRVWWWVWFIFSRSPCSSSAVGDSGPGCHPKSHSRISDKGRTGRRVGCWFPRTGEAGAWNSTPKCPLFPLFMQNCRICDTACRDSNQTSVFPFPNLVPSPNPGVFFWGDEILLELFSQISNPLLAPPLSSETTLVSPTPSGLFQGESISQTPSRIKLYGIIDWSTSRPDLGVIDLVTLSSPPSPLCAAPSLIPLLLELPAPRAFYGISTNFCRWARPHKSAAARSRGEWQGNKYREIRGS